MAPSEQPGMRLESAFLAAEQTVLQQRPFMVSGSEYQALMDL